MVAESETTVSKRKIRELRVVDLRNELERRGLDKTGVKALLVDRLSKALQDEGHNPDEYFFESTQGEKKPLKRNMGNHDSLSNPDSTHDGGDLSMTNDYDEDAKEDLKEEPKKDCIKDLAVSNPPPAKEESTEVEPMPPPASAVKVETKHENNEVVEDSINLTLEDEENFEEEESHAQEKDEPRPPELTRSRGGSIQREEMISSKKSLAASVGSHGGSTGSGQTTGVSSTAANISDLSSYDAKSTCSSSTSALSASQTGATDDGEEDLQHHSKHHHTNASVEKESKMPSTMDNSASSSSSGEKAKSSTGSGSAGATKEGLTSKITSVGNKDDRDKKNAGSANSSRNLWVSGMSMSTKATDLKHLFSKYGRVIGAKVVTNARTPGARCYGYVTMANSEDASKCIQHLHRTELHGRMISVERAKGENGGPRKATESKLSPLTAESASDKAPAADSQEETNEKKAEDSQDVERPNSAAAESASTADTGTAFVKDNEDGKSTTSESKSTQVQQHGQNRDERFKERERVDRRPGGDRRRPPSPHRPRPGVLTFQQIREERERHRQREREREEREAERRRREEMARQREQERKQREEAIRLEKERERLRIERERLEREKAELMRLERERQRLEREKIEQEREELKRQQARSLARLEEVRRATKRPSVTERDADFYDRKRMTVEAAPSARYSSSQSRFEESKSSSHYSSGSVPAASDYRKVADRGYVDSRSRGERFDRTAGASSSSVVTRRVVEEVGPARRDARPPPSPPRERDDRRVVERVRDDRYDRSSRGSGSGRDQPYSERDRERERERERERPRERVAGGPSERDRESARGRMDRDHRTDRYPPDSRSKGNGSDHRFGERGGSDGGWRGSSSGVNSSIGVVSKSGSSYGNTGSSANNALLGNGGAASHHNPRESHHTWGAANDRNKTSGDGNGGHPSSVNTTTSWNSTTAPAVDRWGSSSTNLVSLGGGRAMTSGASFANNWPNQSANPINSNVFTSNAALTNLGNVLGQSGSMNNYAADRYSRH